MAQPIACDICQEEQAVQMLTSLETGDTIAMGPACLPVFYGQSLLTVTGAGEHKGLPQKCQACRRIHERMTLAVRPVPADAGNGPGNVKDQAGPAHDQGADGQDEARAAAPGAGARNDKAAGA